MADQLQNPESTAEEKTEAAGGEMDHQRSIRSAIVGSTIIQCILAIFLINILNSVSANLDRLNQSVDAMFGALGNYQLSDIKVLDKDGEEVYTFRRNRQMYMLPEAMPPAFESESESSSSEKQD